MTADTEVSVLPEAEIEEEKLSCGLVMNSYQDLTSVGAEGDGANPVVRAETNSSDRDDSENSYVFVNGSDGTSDDPGANELNTDVSAVSAQTKAAEDSTASVEAKSFAENHGAVQGNGVAFSTSEASEDCLAGEKSVDGTQVASDDSVENHMEEVESQKDEHKVEFKPQTSQDQVDLKASSVSSDSEDTNQITQHISPDSAVDLVNLDSATEQNNIDLTVDQNNSYPMVDVVNADSVNELNKLGSTNNLLSTSISAEGQNMNEVMDAPECESQKTETWKVNHVDQTLQPCYALEEGEKGRMAPLGNFECKSKYANTEVGEVNAEQQFEVMETKVAEHGESCTHVNVHVESNSCEEACYASEEGEKCITSPLGDFECKSKHAEVGELNAEQQSEEMETKVAEHGELYTHINIPVESNSCEEACNASEEGEKCRTAPLEDIQCKSEPANTEVREGNAELESEVMETKVAEHGELYTHVNILMESNSCEEACYVSEEGEKCRMAPLGDNECKSEHDNTEDGEVNAEQQSDEVKETKVAEHSESYTHVNIPVESNSFEVECYVLEEGEKCRTAPLGDFEGKPEHGNVEVGEANAEQQSEVMATEVADPGESYSHVNIHVESNSCELDHEGEKLEDESSKGFVSDANKNPEIGSIGVVLDQEHEIENAVNENLMCLETGIAISPVLCEKQDSLVVSHATDSVSQSEEGGGQLGEISYELSRSSEEAKIMGTPAACMMNEGDKEKPIEPVEKVSADSEIRYETSLPAENISVQVAETLEPMSYDEHVVSCMADDSCSLAMNSLVNDTSLITENGIQNSASEEVSALAGNSSLQDLKLQNLHSEAAVVESMFLGDDHLTSGSPTNSSSEITFGLMTVKYDEKVQSGTEISNEDAELAHGQSSSTAVQLSEVENSSTSINRDMHSDDTLESGLESRRSSVDKNISPPNHPKNMEIRYSSSERSNDENLLSQECVVAEESWCNETSDTMLEGSSAKVVAGQDIKAGTVGGLRRPFHFLIKMPRFDDEKLREQIRLAQLHVDEKTQSRDAIWQEIKEKRANCQHLGVEFEAAKSEERAARKQVRSKRTEIEHLQTTINRVKNAISVEEIDARICSMEHMIEHETLPLKEEKNLIREIKQLKQLRNQLSSNIGSCDEVQQALDNKAQIEESLKILKKELDSLKSKVSKAEAVAVAVSLRYEEESRIHKELRAQYKAANEIRQAAYENLQNLKKRLYEKNKHFRIYKGDTAAANGHATRKDTEALHHLCGNQVESYMELWNRDDEFRKEYVRCNMRSTIRRLGTLDGRSLGPDEDPPVLPVYIAERTDKVVSCTSKVDLVSTTLPTQQEKQVILIKDEDTARNPLVKVEQDRKIHSVKPNLVSKNTVSSLDVSSDVRKEVVQTKEELELARKEEELRKLETASRLKEQRRLEEIAKAKEALERKKRNAEKAQVRAELRAQKEAEQREKEREKRLRKKERKKGGGSEAANESESASICEYVKDVNEAETKEDGRKSQRAPQYTKQSKTKSIPPPLRNKSKRKMQQWVRIILTSFVVIALFLLGNIGFFASLKHRQNVS